jgi:metallo-beta-lactamase family protein
MIILSSSGMLNAGRVLSYLPHILSNPNNCIVFCGYSTEGTLAWQIKEGDKKRIKIGEEWVNNRANIINLYSFSSHMQHNELLQYYSTIQANKIYLVHGQMDSKLLFAKELKDALEHNNRTTQVICVNKGTKGRL